MSLCRTLDSIQAPLTRQQIETALLEELRQAEAEFKQAGPERKQAAEEEFRTALRRFSQLILEGRVPPGMAVRF